MELVHNEAGRTVKIPVDYYNLDFISNPNRKLKERWICIYEDIYIV
jgi:hypothetical protein